MDHQDGDVIRQVASQDNPHYQLHLEPPERMPDGVMLLGTPPGGQQERFYWTWQQDTQDVPVEQAARWVAIYLAGLIDLAEMAINHPDRQNWTWQRHLALGVMNDGWQSVGTWTPTPEGVRQFAFDGWWGTEFRRTEDLRRIGQLSHKEDMAFKEQTRQRLKEFGLAG